MQVILFFGCWTTKEGASDAGHYFAGPAGLADARAAFPQIFRRFKYEIVLPTLR